MRFVIRVFWLLLLFGGASVVVLGLLTLERAPSIARPEAPTSEDIAAARSVLHQFRKATGGQADTPMVRVTKRQADALLAMGARVVPGARGEATFSDGVVRLRGALPVPGLGLWLNGSVSLPDFDHGVALSDLRLGRLSIPPGLALGVARHGASLVLGRGAGDALIAAFPAMTVTPKAARVSVAVDEDGRGDMARTLFSVFRGDRMPHVDEVLDYRAALVAALDAGRLSPSGSFAPLLAFALGRAYDKGRSGDLGREYTAAIFALTSACGSEMIRGTLGKLLPGGGALDTYEGTPSPCGDASLHDRVDLRRHFITAATLQAASNRGVAVSIGEFKELNDMAGWSGFDFTDIVANNSGIRLSDRMMRASAQEWPDLLAMLDEESNYVASIDGIPTAMPRARFEARFETLDSPQYLAMLARIEERIDTLPIHRAAPADGN